MRLGIVAVAFVLVAGGTAPQPSRSGTDFLTGAFEPPRAAPDFILRTAEDPALRLRDLRGRVVALGFGYTSCPDVCPTTLAELAEVRRRIGSAAAQDFTVLYVTVDPERDTAERLQAYARAFDPTFLGLTGDVDALAAVRTAYGIFSEKREASTTVGNQVHHSAFVYLIDRMGTLRLLVPFGTPVADVTHDVNLLLKE